MKRKTMLISFLFGLVLLALVGASAKFKTQKTVTFELQRHVLGAWTKNSSKYVNDFCFQPKASRPKRPLIFNTPMPSNCSEARISRISQECVFKNLAYNARIYYDAVSNSTLTTSETSVKKLELSNEYVDLAVDLTSPWSWVKSPVCQTCDRHGKNCILNQCKYSVNASLTFEKSFTCANCQIVQKCGEIDSYAEGMTVVGQFVHPEKLRFKDSFQTLTGSKFLWAHALSGQEFLMADGVLGLGIESNLHSQSLSGVNSTPKSKKVDEFRQDDERNDDDEDDEQEQDDEDPQSEYEDENWEDLKTNSNSKNDEAQKVTNPTSTATSKKYDFFEADMNIMKPVENQFRGIKSKMFSLYVAEDDSLKYVLTLGEPVEKYIYKPSENRILWLNSMVSTQLMDQYSLWVVNLKNIRIARLTEELKEQEKEYRKKSKKSEQKEEEQSGEVFDRSEYLSPVSSISLENPHTILSLSTTAIVLPGKELNQLLEILKDEFGVVCEISKEFLYFVVCNDIKSPKQDLADLTMIIEIGYHSTIHLQVNPNDLILDCKKNSKAKDSTYKCQMNLQQSYDDKIILGEAALRNQYMVFDQSENMIGFAPAKNIFNDASFIRKISHLFAYLEESAKRDVTFIILFLGLAILLGASFLFLKHGPTLIALIKGKRVLVLDDKNDRMKLASDANETMDESTFQELNQMHRNMEDSGIQETNNNNNSNSASQQQPQDVKPINLDDL